MKNHLTTRTILDDLTPLSVSVQSQQFLPFEDSFLPVGEPHRVSFQNNSADIERMNLELEEPYLSSVLSVWGIKPGESYGQDA